MAASSSDLNIRGPLEKLKAPIILHDHKVMAANRKASRGYKYFSSINIFHFTKTKYENKFHNVMNKARYVTQIKIPMALSVNSTGKILKNLKRFNKTTTHYNNTLSYLLPKLKKEFVDDGFSRRLIKNAQILSESSFKKITSLYFLKLQRRLQTLNLNLFYADWPNQHQILFQNLSHLKELKSVYIALSALSDTELEDAILELTRLPVIESLSLNIHRLSAISQRLILDKSLKRFTLASNKNIKDMIPFIKGLASSKKIRELNVLFSGTSTVATNQILQEEILEILSYYALENSPTEPDFSNYQAGCLNLETPEYVLEMKPTKFYILRK